MVQVPEVVPLPAGTVPPVSAIWVLGVMDSVPPQPLLSTVLAIMPAGIVSVKAALNAALVAELTSTKVMVEV